MPNGKKKSSDSQNFPFKAKVKLAFEDGTTFDAVFVAGLEFNPEAQAFEANLKFRSADNTREASNQLLLAMSHALKASVNRSAKVRKEGA